MLSSRTQKWWAIGAGLSVVLLAATWFLMVGPQRASAADLDLQTENLQQQTSQQQIRTAQLKAALAQVPKKKAELAAIKAQLPPVADIPRAITDLEGFATTAGVTLDQVTPGTPTVAGGTATVSTAGATAVKPVLVQIPVSIQTTGDYFESSLFLKSLQTTMTRSILVQSIQVAGSTAPAPTTTTTTTTDPSATPSAVATAPAATVAKVSMSITGQLFVLLDGSTTLADVKKDAAKSTP